MALAILSVGATGVIAMQKATLVGNVNARDLSTATAIADKWLERLRNDGLSWSVTETGLNTITTTRWLNVVGTDFPQLSSDEGVWFRPTPVATDGISPQADVNGNDTFVDAEAGFCTHLRLTQLMPSMIRAEVRVFWLRRSGDGTGGEPLCSDDSDYIDNLGSKLGDYHFVYMATGVLRNDAI